MGEGYQWWPLAVHIVVARCFHFKINVNDMLQFWAFAAGKQV